MKVNVGTIGHIDHGKTTLTAALVKVLGEDMASRVIIVDSGEGSKLISENADFDGLMVSPYDFGRKPNSKRKAERAARMKAAQLKAFGAKP